MAPRDITTILSASQLQELRAGYSLADLIAGATYALADARFPPARATIDALYDHFYPDPEAPLFFDGYTLEQDDRAIALELNNATRELLLVGILAATGDPFQLSVHIYWALMCGASPTAIANALLLSGIYGGIPGYANGISTTQQAFEELASLADAGKTTAAEVLGAFQIRFGTGNPVEG